MLLISKPGSRDVLRMIKVELFTTVLLKDVQLNSFVPRIVYLMRLDLQEKLIHLVFVTKELNVDVVLRLYVPSLWSVLLIFTMVAVLPD